MVGKISSSLRARFALLAGVLAALVIGVNALLIAENAVISRQAGAIAEREFPVLNKAHALKLTVVQVQQWLTDISATRGRDGLDDGFAEAAANAERARTLLAELERLDAGHGERYRAMGPVFEDYYRVGRAMAQAYIEAGPAGGNPMMAGFDEVAARMTGELDALLEDATLRATQAVATQQAAVGNVRTYIWGSAFVVLVMVVVLYVIIARALAVLPRVADELRKVAQGDLTSACELRRDDEIGRLVQALNDMRGQLRGVVAGITGASQTLASAAEEMSSITAETEAGVGRQRSETEQVATAMNEMTATAQDVAGNIAHAARAAEDAHRETLNGEAIVEAAVRRIGELASQIEGSGETVSQMERHSEEISSVLDVIRGVAEQTNLLALNAAIEAARAGEHGRGFAVVADEVRTLASRTQKSTEEINRMIEQLRGATGRVVEAMGSSREQARDAVERASAAGESLGTIASAVSRINEMSTQIASAAEEQSAVSEEINRSVLSIREMNEENAARSGQTAVASNELARLAAELEGMVRGFRI